MNTQFIYPQNMRASATIWLWSLKHFTIIVVAALLSAITFATTRFFIPAVATAVYAFLCIRTEDVTILDFIKYAVRYFITSQQYYEWELKDKKTMKEGKAVEKQKE